MASQAEQGAGRGEGELQTPSASDPKLPIPARYCAVYDCLHNYRTHPELSFFGFPQDTTRVKEWAEKIRRPDIVLASGRVSAYYRVCEVHFLPRHINANKRRQRLLRSAVPMLRLPHAGPYVRPAPAPPTPRVIKGRQLVRSSLEVCEYIDDTPKRKTKKRRDYKKIPKQPTPAVAPPALAELYSECDRHLAPSTARFIKLVAGLRHAGGRYQLCLKLLHTSPSAYHLLQTVLALPSVRALQRLCAPLLPDFDNKLTDLLKTRLDRMTEKDKHCTLSVEFVEVRPHVYYNITFDRIVGLHEVGGDQSPQLASRAAVVSARGLLTRWAQPVALCFLARDDAAFDRWIDQIVHGLLALGLKVRALVCDPATPATPRGSVSPNQPFFHVGDAKIYHVYDPPGLMKMLLYVFITYDFSFEKTTAKWSEVLDYLKIERHKPLTLTPALTNASTEPRALGRMRPARAARLLNRALAAAIASYVDQGLLPETARATGNFILKISNLYDILSSTTTKTNSEFKKALSQDPGQIGFLTYMKTFFKCLKVEDGLGTGTTETKKLFDSWQITIAAVLGLLVDLQPVQFHLLTSRLHLDDKVAESARRVLGVRGAKPTCQQVFVAFKRRFLDDILQPIGEVDRDPDLNSILSQIINTHPSPPIDGAEAGEEMRILTDEYRQLRLPRRNGVATAARHLLRAARLLHGDCARSRSYTAAPPQPDFLELVGRLDEALCSALRQDAQPARALLRELLLDLHVLDCELPCECFPLERLKMLFLRLRLYRLLRHNQARLKHKHYDSSDLDIDALE